MSEPAVCTAVVVRDHRGRFLLLERAPGRTFAGTWCFPGGRLRFGEDPKTCAVRELEEETDLTVRSVDLKFDLVTNIVGDGVHLVGLVYRLDQPVPAWLADVAANHEPDKHSWLGWFDPNDLPEPLMEGTRQWFARRRGRHA